MQKFSDDPKIHKNFEPERTIPRDPAFDSTIAVVREGYRFIANRCRSLRSDIFQTRLLLRRATCMRGEEAARIFYGGENFTRVGAIPATQAKLLQDYGSVQGLDGEHHRHRKRLFTDMFSPQEVARLTELTAAAWRAKLPSWERRKQIVLFDELREILCGSVCAWAGVPLSERDASKRTLELGEMIEASGSIGPRNWRAQWLRSRCERWARSIIERVRCGELRCDATVPVRVIAEHREPDGSLLSVDAAVVELINVLRATVAVARFIVFGALALHEHPACVARLAKGDDAYARAFAQEVRRLYPFFPFIAGRVTTEFAWSGHRFAKGDWVLLDLYGTNHDERIFPAPEEFQPERFLHAEPGPFAFIPQGGGDTATGHRCPGEDTTIALIMTALNMLTKEMRYEVPPQNLEISLAAIPALPHSRFVIGNVARVPARPTV